VGFILAFHPKWGVFPEVYKEVGGLNLAYHPKQENIFSRNKWKLWAFKFGKD
jgi:hypothetical protein